MKKTSQTVLVQNSEGEKIYFSRLNDSRFSISINSNDGGDNKCQR